MLVVQVLFLLGGFSEAAAAVTFRMLPSLPTIDGILRDATMGCSVQLENENDADRLVVDASGCCCWVRDGVGDIDVADAGDEDAEEEEDDDDEEEDDMEEREEGV